MKKSNMNGFAPPPNWRVAKKREAKQQVVLSQYLRESKMYGYFELKNVTNTLPFSKIEQVQFESSPAMEKKGLVWKFSDEDSREKPCDCISAPPMTSYLVIKFKEPSEFHFIPMSKIIDLRDSGAVGINQKKSAEIAEKIIKI